MTRKWGVNSERKLLSVDPFLVECANEVLQLRDITIVTGHRGEQEQNQMFELGRSKVKWPNGKHNTFPSKAIDFQPYPYPQTEAALREDLSYIAGLFVGIAASKGRKLRWGGDWDRDGETEDNGFDDLFHIEIDD
jgi:peptidoglycan L-alanyl-D-glutamate endopeptidase CwlK